MAERLIGVGQRLAS